MTYTPITNVAANEAGDDVRAKLNAMIAEVNMNAKLSKTLFVDGARTDTYVADGSKTKPFKTLVAAAAAASAGDVIVATPGTYADDVTIPGGVSLVGYSDASVVTTGDVTFEAGSPSRSIYGIVFHGTDKTLTLNGTCNIKGSYSKSKVVCGATAAIYAVAFPVKCEETDADAITFGGVYLRLFDSEVEATGDASAIVQTAGQFIGNTVHAKNEAAANATILSTGGTVGLSSSIVANAGGGEAINVSDNDGEAINPNGLNGIIAAGNIVCGTKHTVRGVIYSMSGTVAGDELLGNILVKNGINGSLTCGDKTATVVDGQITAIAE